MSFSNEKGETMAIKRWFLFFCLISIFSIVADNTKAAMLKAPSETLSVQSFNKAESSVEVQGWYCTRVLKGYEKRVRELIKEIRQKKSSGQSAIKPKIRLLSIAKGLEGRKNQDPVTFWKEYKNNRKGKWLWKANIKQGNSMEFKESNCYSMEELERAKKNSLSWAGYIIKFYGYLEK